MEWILSKFLLIISLIFRLFRPNGVREIISENLLLKQQLLVLTRHKKKSPPLLVQDRIVMAFCAFFMTSKRIQRSAIAVASSTVLAFHKALVNKKYAILFGVKGKKKKSGPKGPSKTLIKFIVEMKEKNPGYGSQKISFLASNVLEMNIDECLVRRILKKYYKPLPGDGPSWLAPIGNMPNKLWSLDFFRIESIFLQSYWVMLVMDQYTRKIIGFSVHKGSLSGSAACFMFNKVVAGKQPPTYLSTDNDPLFKYWLWEANFENYGIEEIKSVPNCPWSHPFIERKIGSCRREFTDRTLFYSTYDIEEKFAHYVDYFNKYRVHVGLDGRTPNEKDGTRNLESIELENYSWRSICRGLFQTPIAA